MGRPASQDESTGSATPPGAGRLAAIATAFRLPAAVARVEPLGNGNVNDTWLVTTVGDGRGSGDGGERFVLQRLNTAVFRRPELVMANIQRLGEHVDEQRRRGHPQLDDRRWEVPRVVPVRAGGAPGLETEEGYWRTLTFLDASHSVDTVSGPGQARAVGEGLGVFHALIHDLPAEDLADTLEGFHVTPAYLDAYRRVLANPAVPCGAAEEACRAFIERREAFASVLEDARAGGRLRTRPIHGDPKVNNVMLDRDSGRAIGLVDLDTVKPGLVHWDIGDCLRSACNPLGEEAAEPEAVRFDPDLCAALLEGYLGAARPFLSAADIDHVYDAIRLISFELGLRFFSDHLAGSVYFKSDHPGHNLQRARVQFGLTQSIEAQEGTIRSLIERLR